MLVRSSKYFQSLVDRDRYERAAKQAQADVRTLKVGIERAERELQESKDDYLHRLLQRHVIVHLHTPEMSIEGHLTGVYADSVVLANGRVPVTPAGDIQQLDGAQIIPKSQIAWVSELNA